MTAVDASLWSNDVVPTAVVVYENTASSCWSDSTWGGEAVPLARQPEARASAVESPSVANVAPASPTPSATSCASSTQVVAAGAGNCKFFANGGCLRGDACPFSHDLTINATSDADASRGFVLTGQVVNLKQQQSALAKAAAVGVKKNHSMNPDAAPFVAPWASSSAAAAEGVESGFDDVGGGQFPPHSNAADHTESQSYAAYRNNSRQPPLGYAPHHLQHLSSHAHYQTRPHMYPDQHDDMQAEWERGTDEYHRHDAYADQHAGGGWGYDTVTGPYGYANNHQPQDSHPYPASKWTPSGVFSTTADSGMAREALAGYYDQATRYKEESSFHHRRLQAMRPPLQSTSRGGESSASSQASFSEEEATDRNYRVGFQDHTASYGRKFQPYPLPEGAYHSAEAHRRLRNRSEI